MSDHIMATRHKHSMRLLAAVVGLIGCGALVSRAQDTHYVAQAGQTPAGTYTTWDAAASNIQDAINVTGSGDTVLVSNGVYATGETLAPGNDATNRVCITSAITLQSFKGPEVTIIQGGGTGWGDNSGIRCVYLTNAVALIGFTLTNGHASFRSSGGGCIGGGVYAASSVLISNCVFASNTAYYNGEPPSAVGGGVYLANGGTVANCVFSRNRASSNYGSGGGLYIAGAGTVVNCVFTENFCSRYGGGACLVNPSITLSNCVFIKNTSGVYGGGVDPYQGRLVNCLLAENGAGSIGGGVANYYGWGFLENCTIVSNYAGSIAGGVYGSQATTNCIIWGNYNTGAGTMPNWGTNAMAPAFPATFTCTTPLPAGAGNIAVDPSFMNRSATDYHLRMDSPCINTGTNQAWMTNEVDLDGRPRIQNGIVDMGAYEKLRFKGTAFTGL